MYSGESSPVDASLLFSARLASVDRSEELSRFSSLAKVGPGELREGAAGLLGLS